MIIANKVWKALESIYEGEKHAKRIKLQIWIFLFQEAKMMEDESVRTYASRIWEIIVEIKAYRGKKEEDEIIWKILKMLTPPFKKVAMMIEQVIPHVDKFLMQGLLENPQNMMFKHPTRVT